MKVLIKRVICCSALLIILYSCFSVFTDLTSFCLLSLIIPTAHHIAISTFLTCYQIIIGPIFQLASLLLSFFIDLISHIKDCFLGIFQSEGQSDSWFSITGFLRYAIFMGVVYVLVRCTKIRSYEDLFTFMKYFFLFMIYWAKQYQCAICHQKQVYTKLKCGHRFHLDCIDVWSYRNGTCPYCRTLIIYEEVQICQKFKAYLR